MSATKNYFWDQINQLPEYPDPDDPQRLLQEDEEYEAWIVQNEQKDREYQDEADLG